MSEHFETIRKNPFIEEMGMPYRQALAFTEREAEQEPQWGTPPDPVPVISERVLERIDVQQLAAEVRGWRTPKAEMLLRLARLEARLPKKDVYHIT